MISIVVKIQTPFKVMRTIVRGIASAFKIIRGDNSACVNYFIVTPLKADPGAIHPGEEQRIPVNGATNFKL